MLGWDVPPRRSSEPTLPPGFPYLQLGHVQTSKGFAGDNNWDTVAFRPCGRVPGPELFRLSELVRQRQRANAGRKLWETEPPVDTPSAARWAG